MSDPEPPAPPDPLTTRVMEVYTHHHWLAYAEIAPDLTVPRLSPNFQAALGGRPCLPGQPLLDMLDIFWGSEETLAAILHGERRDFLLEQVNWESEGGATRYLTFWVGPLLPESPDRGLLLVVEDSTAAGLLQQQLVQDRNELRLLQGQLARANDALRHLSRFKSFLLSMAAHDLRSSLTVIEGYSDLLVSDPDLPPLNPEQQHALITIHDQALEMERMLTSLLDLDQIEQGKLAIRRVPCDLRALVAEEVQVVQPLCRLQGLTLSFDPSPHPIELAADPARLRQVMQNLLTNAIKYTPAGGQIACLLALDRSTNPPHALLRIADSGQGMTAEELASLFQLYYRTEGARESSVVGSGLGLFIVKTLIEAHEGQIGVASQVGQGTVFTITLPVRGGDYTPLLTVP